jgi:uncharacterized repeat protein (TIGR01451 family)
MKKFLTPLTLMLIVGMVLTACNLGTSTAATDIQTLATPTLTLSQMVSIELVTQVDTAIPYNAVGQIMKFKYTVKMLRNDSVGIPANLIFAGAVPVCPAITTVGNLNDRLDPGEVIDCTFDYPLTQADLDRGSVSNVVTATAYTVNSNTVTTNVATVPSKMITLTKTANPATYSSAGQEITYTYTIKNSGSTPLGPGQFTVADTAINNNTAFNCGNVDATIAPGATITCTGKYLTTATDATAASIASNAVASGGGANPSQPAAVTVTKTAVSTGATVQHTVADGEWLWQIARCYGADPEATIAANKQLANPAQLKAGIVVTVPNIGSNGAVHAPANPCIKKHIVQSTDTWTSIAQLYGADPGLTQMANSNILTVGKEVRVPLYTQGLNIPLLGSATAVPATSGLLLTVTASKTTYSQAGETITYTYLIKNNGTTNLGPAQFTITDALISPTAFNCGASTTLSPGATTTCNANYVITQNDMGKDSILNSAIAGAVGIPNSPAAGQKLTRAAASILLTVVANPTTYNAAGQVITFNYTITNTGTLNIGPTQFVITDILVNPAAFNCGAANVTIAPTQTVTCSATYTTTENDLTKASFLNSATASGVGAPTSQPAGQTITKQ